MNSVNETGEKQSCETNSKEIKPTIRMKELYFERQTSQYCLKHALNHLLQEEYFSVNDLNAISYELTPFSFFRFNPHKSFFGGNWDVNVLIHAVENVLNMQISWWDNRKSLSKIDECSFGLIINFNKERFLYGGNHWISLKNFDGIWVHFDSELRLPIRIGNFKKVCLFIDKYFPEAHVFVIQTSKNPE
eukprot:TRINITY_DN1471_c0_g1_i1.p1 TRINITY_DN1471_c0_g1~~TRINITY_DN1471_c0_g1_i1.p1  ORF type:complete len:201 (+),score=43.14 TRINITY_DN1471_c0_g1_i1:37-603(+)